jgi:holliday junction DNA helicase RuvA
MISRIKGVIWDREDFIHFSGITIELSGLGLYLLVPKWDLGSAALGDEIELFTDFIVREDAMVLYGFSSSPRRSLFRTLQTVSGVGPKVALTMISSTNTEELVEAIVESDLSFLEKLPGIGKKVASRIVLELKEKMNIPSRPDKSWRSDITQGLVNLGYSEKEAGEALENVDKDLDPKSALKAALASLNSKRG